MILLTAAMTLGLVVTVGRWQTKTLHEEVASLTAKCQFLERNTEGAIARGEVAIKALEATRMNATEEPQRYSLTLLHTVKLGFNDIQHQVAAGRFAGLALTDGYREMKQVLDNPAFEEMLARDHGLTGR